MDKLQWFKFTPSDWIMGKIQRCSEITQARFMRLCCVYWNKDCNMTYEDAEVEIDKKHLDILISKRVLKNSNGIITIVFLLEQIKEIEIDKSDKSQSGQIGNLKRWHRPLYDKFIRNELTLNQAINESKLSHPDSLPIDTQSQNIAEKSREELEKKRKEEIILNKTLLSEIKISDDKNFFLIKDLKIGLGKNQLQYFNTAIAFQKLFIKNLSEKKAPTSQQENATFKNYVDPIRLMIEKNEATKEQLIEAYGFLGSEEGEFWKSNILSTQTLRKQIPTLLAKKNTKKTIEKNYSVPDHRKRNTF